MPSSISWHSDNFPGCPGVGEKTAVKLINEFGSISSLIERSAEIKGKLREKVEEHVDDIKMSYFLATIKTDVPIALDMESLKLVEPNSSRALQIEFLKNLKNHKFLLTDNSISLQNFPYRRSILAKIQVLKA